MSHDVFKPISPTIGGEETPENRRIVEVANELSRRCRIYAAQFPVGKSHGSPFEIEQRVAELFAKEYGLWIPFDKVFSLGAPGPSGNENDTYVAKDIIYKINNLHIPCSPLDFLIIAVPIQMLSATSSFTFIP